MYVYNLYWRHNCEYLYSEERTTGGFLRMATNKPPCVINKERENRSLRGSQVRGILYLFNVFDWMGKVRKKGGGKRKKIHRKTTWQPLKNSFKSFLMTDQFIFYILTGKKRRNLATLARDHYKDQNHISNSLVRLNIVLKAPKQMLLNIG